MSVESNRFLKKITDATSKKKSNMGCRLAIVTAINENNTFIKFFGEEEASLKPYRRINTYTPSIGDTVMLTLVGDSYVITGKVV